MGVGGHYIARRARAARPGEVTTPVRSSHKTRRGRADPVEGGVAGAVGKGTTAFVPICVWDGPIVRTLFPFNLPLDVPLCRLAIKRH